MATITTPSPWLWTNTTNLYICLTKLAMHVCVCVCSIMCDSFATSWTVAHQVPLSMGFFQQECWNGLPFLSSGDLPNPGMEPKSPGSLALASDSYFSTWEALSSSYSPSTKVLRLPPWLREYKIIFSKIYNLDFNTPYKSVMILLETPKFQIRFCLTNRKLGYRLMYLYFYLFLSSWLS